MTTIKGDLIMTEDMTFNEDLVVEGNIYGKDGGFYVLKCWNLKCWNLKCWNLKCWNLNCRDLNCYDLECRNLNCWDLNCRNLNCRNLNCRDLYFYAVAVAYKSFKCKSWKNRRENYVISCLDGKIEIEDKEFCDKCGSEIKGEKEE